MKICTSFKKASLFTLIVTVFALPLAVKAQVYTDNFDSYTTSASFIAAGWNVIVASGGTTLTFPAVGSGKGVRMTTPPGSLQTIYRTNEYTDFYVAADVVNWKPDVDQAIVLFGRATDITGIVNSKEYVMNWDVRQDGNAVTDRLGGQLQITRVDSVVPFATTQFGIADISLKPGSSYRFTFKGVGADFTGEIYDLADLTHPLITLVGNDATYPSGVSGLTVFDRSTGGPDATFDNYYAGPADPNTIAPAIQHPIAGTPQVVTRTPTNRFANFHPVASGISFNARTFNGNPINAAATKLYLNGVDSGPLMSVGAPDNLTFTYGGVLASNTVYNARIELVDVAGTLTSSNTFWFDTFTDAYLLSGDPVKTIEAEDYNFESGLKQFEPIPVSGLNSASVEVGGGAGYYSKVGTPDVDYQINEGGTDGNFVDYRPDRIRNSQGDKEARADGAHPLGDPATRTYDTQRSQYAAVDVQEYLVVRTRVGTWMNYTRTFANTNYNVYLRCGSFGDASYRLDLVGGDITTASQTTTPLGTFVVPNHLWRGNYRYQPLLAGGTNAVITLGGDDTVRLTLNGAPNFQDRLVMLNYLLFVPTSAASTVVLVSSSTVNGTYTEPVGYFVNQGTKTATVPQSGSQQFYQLSAASALTITSINVSGGVVTIKYN